MKSGYNRHKALNIYIFKLTIILFYLREQKHMRHCDNVYKRGCSKISGTTLFSVWLDWFNLLESMHAIFAIPANDKITSGGICFKSTYCMLYGCTEWSSSLAMNEQQNTTGGGGGGLMVCLHF